MLILPAIDIRAGNCVRLYQGKAEQETVYSKDPIEVAIRWKDRGARILHIADLDGAFSGRPANLQIAAEMKKRTGLPMQIGGGYRDFESIERAVTAGMDRVILGTAAVYDHDLVRKAVERFGAVVAVSIDVADDFVAVSGWKEVSSIKFEDLAVQMVKLGVQRLLFTDTRRDGTLSGPNIEGVRKFARAAKVPVIVCGGMSSVRDVIALQPLEAEGVVGAVIGKALYDNKITLEEAIAAAGPQVL